eukprot:gnl/TRDRNA2_/TRDRNA2_99917_c1_seq1.p1 gnl/TRDRNA2_/TRDRNA2_99917_c1~~gnl/TRDRNA2_/TRDRNA2_99917_c1_seq1.p1  ORF type:complete len:135 (-),score=26.10 gnl/TRDRNA2_/TRDRNA2_99917_c1_seq1:59-463(-)
MEDGHQWVPVEQGESSRCSTLHVGDSFGEEIMLKLEERYEYSVVADTRVEMKVISETKFAEAFSSIPDAIESMVALFKGGGDGSGNERRHEGFIDAKPAIIPASFPDDVISRLEAILQRVSSVDAKIENGVPNR